METNPSEQAIAFDGYKMIRYSNDVNHLYGVVGGKLKHIGRDENLDNVLAFHGYDPADSADNYLLKVYEDGQFGSKSNAEESPVALAAEVAATPEVVPTTAERALGATMMAAATGKVRGFFSRINDFKNGVRERFNSLKPNLSGRQWAAAGGLAALAFVSAVGIFENGSSQPTLGNTKAAAAQPATERLSLASHLADVPPTTAPEATTTTPPTTAEQSQNDFNKAIDQKIAEIGLKPGQFNVIADPNAPLPGPIEADTFSMNHSADAWTKGGYDRTTNGAKKMGVDLLSGKNIFSASDASVAQEALRTVANVPQSIIDQIAAGNFDGLTLRMITVDSPVYRKMTFNNNGKLATEALRTGVGKADAIMVISYTNPVTGKKGTLVSRVDCSGIGQTFESVTTPTPPTPAEVTPTTAPAATSTTEVTPTSMATTTTSTTAPRSTTTTSTSIPGTTTTAPRSTTTIPPRVTTTTMPPTTTSMSPTTTTPLRPKPAPAPVPSEVSTTVPSDKPEPKETTTSIAPTPTTENTLPANATVVTIVPAHGRHA